MPRGDRGGDGGEQAELNLVPFMNMVVVIIPMLLLSVVFLKAGVIKITAPKLKPPDSSKPEEQKDDEKKLDLALLINHNGIVITSSSGKEPVKEGCPPSGPTLCLRNDKEKSWVKNKIESARETYRSGGKQAKKEAHKEIQKVVKAFDWMGLYNQLRDIKKEFEDETIVKVSAGRDIPYSLIVRAMDVARYKLEKDEYQNREKFWSAKPKMKTKGNKKIPQPLFNQPILAEAK